MFWKPVFQQGIHIRFSFWLVISYNEWTRITIILTNTQHLHSLSSKQSLLADKWKHYTQSLPIHTRVLPAKLPLLKLNKTACQQQSVRLHRGRSHVICADINHPSAVKPRTPVSFQQHWVVIPISCLSDQKLPIWRQERVTVLGVLP